MEKPKIGAPCNGCGLCCQNQICFNGAYVLQLVAELGETVQQPCPALMPISGGKHGCGIILHPNKYIKNSKYPAAVLSKHFAQLVGAGTGCDELLNDDNPAEVEKLTQWVESIRNNPEWIKKTQLALKVIHGI